MNTDRSDLADDIVPAAIPEHIAPALDEFLPWHKVRKQFIRQQQWNELTGRLVTRYLKLQTEQADWSVDEEPEAGRDPSSVGPESVRIDRPLSCLVIPGDDLLDLRSLWNALCDRGCWIRYLGFNERQGSSQRGTRVHVANNEVTSLPRVDRQSQVLADSFQSIARHNSKAYHYLKKYGPFHIVNLDLCDSLFPTTSRPPHDYFSALHRLAEFQMKSQTTPWLLFITTQVEPGAVSLPDLHALCRPTRQSRDRFPDFAERLGQIVPAQVFSPPNGDIDLRSLGPEEMVRVFGVALGKYLIDLAGSASPHWIVQLLPSYRYAINRQPFVDMLSLAFQFRPIFQPPIDSTGLSKMAVMVPRCPDERECALKVLAAIERIRDVDELLAANSELKTEMEAASADLLEAAGYDRDKYLAWVRSGEGRPRDAGNG